MPVAHPWAFWVFLIPWTLVFVIETPKRHILGWIRVVWCIDRVYPSTVFAVGDDKKKREGKERKGKGRYTKSQVGYISPIWGSDPFGPISTKIGTLVGIYDVIIQSKFGFNILRGFRSTGPVQGVEISFSHWLCWSSLQQCCRYRAACDESNILLGHTLVAMATKICDFQHKIGYKSACAGDTPQMLAPTRGLSA